MSEVCVIVPVYNQEKYLSRCLDSVLAQTYKDFEIVLVNDGSTDKSGEICGEYADKFEFIHVIHQANAGQSAARNAAIDFAFQRLNFEYFCFVDSDDWIHPEYLRVLHDSVKNADIANVGMLPVEEQIPFEEIDSIEIEVLNSLDSYLQIASTPFLTAICAKIIKKNLFESIRFPEGRIYEDVVTIRKLYMSAENCAWVNKSLYYYFQNSDGTTGCTWHPRKLQEIEAYEENLEYFKHDKQYEKIFVALQKRYLVKLDEHRYFIQLSDVEDKEKYSMMLSKKAKKAYFKYGKNIDLPFSENKNIYETAFPRLMHAYWIGHGVRNKAHCKSVKASSCDPQKDTKRNNQTNEKLGRGGDSAISEAIGTINHECSKRNMGISFVIEKSLYNPLQETFFADLRNLDKYSVFVEEYRADDNKYHKYLWNPKFDRFSSRAFSAYFDEIYKLPQIIERQSNKYSSQLILFTNSSFVHSQYPATMLKNLKRKYNCKYVLFYIDNIQKIQSHHANRLRKQRVFDYVFTFDEGDAKKFGISMYQGNYSMIPGDYAIESDLFYCGAAVQNRIKIVQELQSQCNLRNLVFDANMWSETGEPISGINTGFMNYRTVVERVKKSRCILDLTLDGQVGLSCRYLEAVCYNKLLLTSNSNIVNTEYFNPRYMQYFKNVSDIDWSFFDDCTEIDYGYNGEYSPVFNLEEILSIG